MQKMNLENKIIKSFLSLLLLLVIASSLKLNSYAADALTEDEIREIAEDVGEKYCICPEFLQAIAFRESSYIPDAKNKGCKGLMQVNEKCHKDRMERLGVADIYDPYGNVLVAADYLAELFEEYEEADVVLMFYSGNSRAEEYSRGIGDMSDYANDILELSANLEREHGK